MAQKEPKMPQKNSPNQWTVGLLWKSGLVETKNAVSSIGPKPRMGRILLLNWRFFSVLKLFFLFVARGEFLWRNSQPFIVVVATTVRCKNAPLRALYRVFEWPEAVGDCQF